MRHGFFAFVTVTAAGVLISGAAVGLDSNDAFEKHRDTKEQLATSRPTSTPAKTFTVDPKDIAGLIKGVRKISRFTPKGDRAVVVGLLRVLNRHLRRSEAITVPDDDGEDLILEIFIHRVLNAKAARRSLLKRFAHEQLLWDL